jgi:eukaryotic-like serine/threonine-protein kinase
VTVVVSSGVGKVIVPNVVGESRDQATSDLRAAGLSARVVKQTTSDRNADDQVINQAPSAGTKLPRGEAVTINVGKFKEPTTTTTTTTTTTSSTSTTP